MKTGYITFILLLILPFAANSQELLPEQEIKNRVIILADMGNEPDEEQQMMHMLMYSNEFDVAGLIAVTGKFLNPNSGNPEKQRLYPELFTRLIEGYSKVVGNLRLHAEGWPSPDYLHSVVVTGQKGYGMGDVGPGKASPGSEIIIRSLLNDDARPLYVIVNAGSNTLAQALFDLKGKLSKSEMEKIISKLRVFENGAQDDAGAWICSNFPAISWVRSNYQTYCYGGPSIDGGFDNKGKNNELGPYTWEPYQYNGTGQHQWLLENVIGGHGPFGKYYPIRQFQGGGISFMEGGGTIPFLALVNKGLYDISHPWWGGWSGRYGREKTENYWSKHESVKTDEERNAPFMLFAEEPDTWTDPETGTVYFNNLFAPVWRWRRAFVNDFKCRMDWCNQPREKANHNPVAGINGDPSNTILFVNAAPGADLHFDASMSTDPDGDHLSFKWYIYSEAGTYDGTAEIRDPSAEAIDFKVPYDAKGRELHLILELKDDNKIASMYDYRRIVISVN